MRDTQKGSPVFWGGAPQGGDGSGAHFHCNTQALLGVFKILIQFLKMGRPPRRAWAGQAERAARPGLSSQRLGAQQLWALMRGSRCPGLSSPLPPSPTHPGSRSPCFPRGR